MVTRKITIEACRAVSDCGGDFDACRESTFSERELRSTLKDIFMMHGIKRWRTRQFTVNTNVTFLEFDSGNPSHAVGYFSFEVEGPADIIDRMEAAEGDMTTDEGDEQ